ncbi:ankyrin repeat-containing domain protein, partial [Kalaharituber pfeilii]
LDPDTIDDLLYFSRTNDLPELLSTLSEIRASLALPADADTDAGILCAAVDPESGNTVVHMAAANGHVDLLTQLLTSPPLAAVRKLLNIQNSAGNTALHWCSLNGHLAVVKLLVERGASPTVLNKSGHDAVWEAETAGKAEVVEWLLGNCEGLEGAVGSGG